MIKRANMPARNVEIVSLVLDGDTLESVAIKYGLTRARVHQITAKYCRLKNKEFYAQMPQCNTVNLEWLRENKEKFIDMATLP